MNWNDMPCKNCQVYLENLKAKESVKYRHAFVTWCHDRPNKDCETFKPMDKNSSLYSEFKERIEIENEFSK